MAKKTKQKMTKAEVKEIVESVSVATERLDEIREQLSKLNVEDFDHEEAYGVAFTLSVSARDVSDTASSILMHFKHTVVRREAEELRRQELETLKAKAAAMEAPDQAQ